MAAGTPPGGLFRRAGLVPARETRSGLIPQVDLALRGLALAAFVVALIVLVTHMAVRRGVIRPFGRWPRFVRSWSDPVLRPLERRLAGAGANPQDAPLWLLGLVVVAGLFVIVLARWLVGSFRFLASMRTAGPRAWAALVLSGAIWLVMMAILVRVIGSWLGAGRYRPWMRPAYWLTDWIVEPIRRRVPAAGLIDFSPFIAYLFLLLLRTFLLALLGA